MHFIDPFPHLFDTRLRICEVLIEKGFARDGNVLLPLARFPFDYSQ